MRTTLKLLLLTSLFAACNNSADRPRPESDSANSSVDSALGGGNSPNRSSAAPEDPERETRRQITEAIFSSKQEINTLEADISDSLNKSGLSNERRSLFSRTIQQLEASSDVLNKQLEQILVSDLQSSREKLGGIVSKMKGSQKELQSMIGRIDKITGYLQVATNLIQSLSPIKPIIAKPATKPS